jgi:hypothetical protein
MDKLCLTGILIGLILVVFGLMKAGHFIAHHLER